MRLAGQLSRSAVATWLAACTHGTGSETESGAHPGETGAVDSAGDTGGDDLVLVTDSSAGVYRYLQPSTASLVRDVDLATFNPGRCSDNVCAAFGGWASTDAEGRHDELLVTFAPTAGELKGVGVVQKVRLEDAGDTVLWELDSLDFLTHFPDQPDLCSQDRACTLPDAGGDRTAGRSCRLDMPHEVRVLEETETSVLMWIADTSPPTRALKVRLDKGTTCGVVEDVVGEQTTADWGDYAVINDLDVVDLGADREALLLSSLSSRGLAGRSTITLWEKIDSTWNLSWQYPPASAGGYLSAVHNPDWVLASDGQPYLVYANGNGLGVNPDPDDYTGEADHRGSIGVARVGSDGPEYLYDAVVAEGFGFLRDANWFDDGTVLVTDSGCINPFLEGCEKPGQLWHVRIPDLASTPASSLGGTFDATHADMNVVTAEAITARFAQPLQCGLLTPYSTQWLSRAALGDSLSAAAAGSPSCASE